MKFQELQKFCLERGYTVKRVDKHYEWKKNLDLKINTADTVIENYEEIVKDITHRKVDKN
jgi:hypothetical protein